MQTLKNGIKASKFIVLVVFVGLAAFVTLCLLMLSCEAYVFRTTKVLIDEIPIGSKFVEIESYWLRKELRLRMDKAERLDQHSREQRIRHF